MKAFMYIFPLTFGLISTQERQIPTSTGSVKRFYLRTSVGPYYDFELDLRADGEDFKTYSEFIRRKNLLDITNIERKLTFERESAKLERGDKTYKKNAYIQIVKHPSKGNKSRTIADWFLYYKGNPTSIFAVCMLGLPILFGGFIQMMITTKRQKKSKVSRRTWEFPLVPVLMLQQTRREYLLRKKTIRRFCIQWEVGRINIRMNTQLVDLRQILHPPTKTKKAHKYTTWRIIRLICRFNALLALKRQRKQLSQEALRTTQIARYKTWRSKLQSSRYILEKERFDANQINPDTSFSSELPQVKAITPQIGGQKRGNNNFKKHTKKNRNIINNKVSPIDPKYDSEIHKANK